MTHDQSYPGSETGPKWLEEAFYETSVPKKNIALRKAYDEIVRLRSLAQGVQDWKSLYENAVRKHIECDAELGKEIASLRKSTIEECAKVAEAEKLGFLSPEYASNQPFGSLCERFACDQVAEAIRALAVTSTDRECDPNVAPCDDAEFGMKP